MKKLEIDIDLAKKLYPEGSSEFKLLLEKTFDYDFKNHNIICKIKTFYDACFTLGIDFKTANNEIQNLEGMYGSEILTPLYKLKIITDALNEEWIANPYDEYQRKFYVCVSSDDIYVDECMIPFKNIGLFFFENKNLADYCIKQFFSLWEELYNIK